MQSNSLAHRAKNKRFLHIGFIEAVILCYKMKKLIWQCSLNKQKIILDFANDGLSIELYKLRWDYLLRLKSPRFQACINCAQATGLKIFCGGNCPE